MVKYQKLKTYYKDNSGIDIVARVGVHITGIMYIKIQSPCKYNY